MYKLSRAQNITVHVIVNLAKNVFLTGGGGVGKSVIIREIKRQLGRRAMIVTPTGVSAKNVDGKTIHSLLKLAVRKYYKKGAVHSALTAEELDGVTTLIIDEISMVRGDQLRAIDQTLRDLLHSSKSFGGLQIVAVGDFAQLPPIVSSEEEKDWLDYENQRVFAFQDPVWQTAGFFHVELTEVYRQQGELQFVELLNEIRLMENTAKKFFHNSQILDDFNKLISVASSHPENNAITTCETNKRCDEINARQEALIDAPEYTIEGQIEGIYDKRDLPTSKVLRLKIGSKVMILKNNQEESYVNGDIAYVIIIDSEQKRVCVRLERNNKQVWLEQEEWENPMIFNADEDELYFYNYEEKVIGKFTQIPVRLAHAVTVFKSQGLAWDNIFYDLSDSLGLPGHCYTALSRVTSSKGLVLSRPLTFLDIKTEPAVTELYQSLKHYPSLELSYGVFYDCSLLPENPFA